MFSKSIVAAAVVASFATQAVAFSLPSSWSSCFQAYNVTSETSLCQPTLISSISNCIASAGNSTSSAAYDAWLCGYCSMNTASCNPANVSSSSTTLSTSTVTTPVSTGTGVPPAYNNATITSSTPYSPVSTGSWTKPSTPASTTAAPYTGGAAGLSAAGSMVALIGAVAAGIAL